MGLTVYKKIIDVLEKDRGMQEEMGKLAGYSSGSNFRKALEQGRSIEKLDGLVKVIRTLFPDNSDELLIQYANELDTKKMTIKLLLEYATLYHIDELKLVIIDRLKNCSKADSKEWAYVYETDHLIGKGELDHFKGLGILNSKSYSKVETSIYSQIAQLYSYYDMRNIYMLNLSIDKIENEVSQIKNSFLRKAYEGRVFRLKVDVNFHTGKTPELLESQFNIEDALEPTKTNLYLQLANSYMLKSYDKSINYLNKAWEFRNPKSEKEIKQSMNFINLLWGKCENFVFDGTISNELFYYVKSKNKSEAIRVLEKINFEALNDHQKAFNMYYQGLLFGEMSYFYKSIEYFNKAGEKFYKKLPLLELKIMGENEMVLSALSA